MALAALQARVAGAIGIMKSHRLRLESSRSGNGRKSIGQSPVLVQLWRRARDGRHLMGALRKRTLGGEPGPVTGFKVFLIPY